MNPLDHHLHDIIILILIFLLNEKVQTAGEGGPQQAFMHDT
jgi:hypothetical protein